MAPPTDRPITAPDANIELITPWPIDNFCLGKLSLIILNAIALI